MPPIDNVFDIYNETFNKDKPTVDQIVEEIKAELEIKIGEEVNQFAYHLVPIIGEMPQLQQNRIVDRVMCILRDAGIRVQLRGSNLDDSDFNDINFFYPYFNGINTKYEYLHITWYSRNGQEYMKSYV